MLIQNSTPEQISKRAADAARLNGLREKQRLRSLKAMGHPKDPRGDLVKLAVNGSAQAKFNLIALFGAAQAAQLITKYKNAPKKLDNDIEDEIHDPGRNQDEDFELDEKCGIDI